MTSIPELESEFAWLRDTHTREELEELDNTKKHDGHYGHDLHSAISRGQRRKFEAAMDEAERWCAETLRGIDRPTADRLFWHMLCSVISRAEKAGITHARIIERLEWKAELLKVEERRTTSK